MFPKLKTKHLDFWESGLQHIKGSHLPNIFYQKLLNQHILKNTYVPNAILK